MGFVFIADAFVHQIGGGGEINNEEFINSCLKRDIEVKKINSHLVTLDFLKANKKYVYIIGNFVNLSDECKGFISEKLNYIIYEHDHKYMRSRNPGFYKNFVCPKEQLVNVGFYQNAKKTLCQSSFHKDIIGKNINLDNLLSLSGNLWSIKSLEHIRKISKEQKQDAYSIMYSPIPHKNTKQAMAYCAHKKIKYEIVANSNYEQFLSSLGANKGFVFFPMTPETLSRVVVEARMMDMAVITNKKVGATYEPWFEMKGEQLIDYMINKREEIVQTIIDVANE
tara:strand:- start:190 stop:1032 length:843 start_codon:yes stop_codon:yes gene_type:complete